MATYADALPMGAARGRAAGVPWYIGASVAGVTSAIVGAQWDISWHRSIGRDDFWTPAHIAIYLCGVVAGVSCAYLILATTFGKSLYPKEATVSMWGFRGPLGAFITAWGGVAMLTSAPFDDWWHNAYGLDVKILSPPHVVLILGILAIETGALILILGYLNRAAEEAKRRYQMLFLYVGGMILLLMSILVLELTNRVLMHTAVFYRSMALAFPLAMAAVARASGLPWANTIMATVYTLFMLGFQWILPLFPAEPKLGPVYHNVTYFVPPQFPLLLIFPAVALDLLWQAMPRANKWLQAVAGGLVFLGVLLAVQWPFADFLQSPFARNWMFGSDHRDYLTGPRSYTATGLFVKAEHSAQQFWSTMAVALAAAIVMTRIGLGAAAWMRRIVR